MLPPAWEATAKIMPLGSKAARDGALMLRIPWQLGDLRSHSRTVSSWDAEMNWSSTGETSSEFTMRLWPRK